MGYAGGTNKKTKWRHLKQNGGTLNKMAELKTKWRIPTRGKIVL